MNSSTHPNLAIARERSISPHRPDKTRTVTTVAEIRAAVVFGMLSAQRHARAAEFAGDARYHAGGADHLAAVLAFIDGPGDGVIG